MKKILILFLLIFPMVFAVARGGDEKQGEGEAVVAGGSDFWTENYEEAVAMSRKTGRPILANFTGSDWCVWCIRLDKEVFSTDMFKEWAVNNVILLKLDFPNKRKISAETEKQNNALAAKYGIQGFPTILFLKADGNVLGTSGYMEGGPASWIRNAELIIK